MSEWHRWTQEEDNIIRRDYKHTKASKIEIASRLGVTWQAVNGRVQIMGIAKRTDRKSWDPKQDERLMELMGKYSPFTVARKLRRSVNSVVLRFKRLGGSRRLGRDGWYTKQEVCEILGVDHHWIQRRIDCGALKASYHHGHRPDKLGAASWHIDEKDLRAYLIKHSIELNSRNVDLPIIIDLILNGRG